MSFDKLKTNISVGVILKERQQKASKSLILLNASKNTVCHAKRIADTTINIGSSHCNSLVCTPTHMAVCYYL